MQRITGFRGDRNRHRPSRSRYCCLLLAGLALLLVLIPAVLAAPAAGSDPVPDAGAADGPASLDAAAGPRMAVATPAVAPATRPTTAPARLNRTSLVQAAKNIGDRQKVTVPAGLFWLIVAIAFSGLLAILYLLLRRAPKTRAGAATVPAGTPTVAGPAGRPAAAPDPGPGGAADMFPPALRNRFSHPELIGEGGLARVFRATDVRTGATVAVKVPVRFNETTGTHFIRDIALWQGLGHENIIRIRSANILPVPYIEMEYAPSSLAALRLPLPERDAVSLVLQVARGVAYAHGRGIIHRDIKPENILLSAEGVPMLTDWGLGKAIGDPRQSTVIGFSPAYAAPEQIAPHRFGKPGPATDIYQLGMLLCELLTGATAFRGGSLHDLNTAILEEAPAVACRDERVSKDLERIIRKCLAKRPEDRYPSAAALASGLEAVLARPGPEI